MIEISLDDTAITDALRRLGATLTDMSPVMQEIAEGLQKSTQDRIMAGQSPDGTSFAPRSQVTLARYEKKGWSFRGPLMLTGTMQSQIFAEADSTLARIGSNALQAAVMQFGRPQGASRKSPPIPWGNIPARPFLGLSVQDKTDVLAIAAKALARATE